MSGLVAGSCCRILLPGIAIKLEHCDVCTPMRPNCGIRRYLFEAGFELFGLIGGQELGE